MKLYDVAVVGLGPVGQAVALLLAERGHSVLAIEKQEKPYPLPRAVTYTPDVARLIDQLGLSDKLAEFSVATDTYEWQTADRQTMLRFDFSQPSGQGWPASTMFNQPSLENALRERGADYDNITVRRGTELRGLHRVAEGANPEVDGAECIRLDVTSRTTKYRQFFARYVIGADGANSTVRQYTDSRIEDLGFFYEWLVLDLIPDGGDTFTPDNLQVCDPARPVTTVSAGPGRRRFEFMRMPDDDLAVFNSDQAAWSMLEPWGYTPENTQLERRALYTFQARWVDRWRDGRLLLAGDAAHLMPPFYGQGMVSGMRDAANLAWKLDLVLRGSADEGLLDTYSTERAEHVKHAIAMSVELGKVICEVDPDKVAARDAHFLAAGPNPQEALPPLPPERLGPGATVVDTTDLPGLVSVNGQLTYRTAGETVTKLGDQLAPGATLVVVDGEKFTVDDVADALAKTTAACSWRAGEELVIVRLEDVTAADLPISDPTTGVINALDVGGVYRDTLTAHKLSVVVIRPDFYYAAALATDTDQHLTGLLAEVANAYQLEA
ncbi:bifunctional 3-(3-hydroxy-phenyl)propionate/3-hydroxycinnamic acid hydroxylase MhpA [Enteractinococcus helveticum]|uniref:FAD-binding domain-containing protein n=1 Tax=Enteractinococcus helveticum TaxID=1837282 RepID=A0A1B7M0P2_9MICC|nr:bifunctional 3-(3-hydroxy-phenyl)propionate/3-hydroxycinnamic acid hydroxylase [Enteractinococcus helveticum]OAV61813.1 hypothetical protein A6F49_07920 [Enteractinococcus helveticum]